MHVYYVWRYLRLVHMGMKKQCLGGKSILVWERDGPAREQEEKKKQHDKLNHSSLSVGAELISQRSEGELIHCSCSMHILVQL